MTRDELEATFRRYMTDLQIQPAFHNRLIVRFLPAVDAYATGDDPELTTWRRALLAEARRPVDTI